MPALGAVEPDGLLVPDGDRVGQDVGCGTKGGVGGHEAGVEGGGHVGHDVCDGHARLIERGLGDRVVLQRESAMFEWDIGAVTYLGVEMELNHVTNCCADVAW